MFIRQNQNRSFGFVLECNNPAYQLIEFMTMRIVRKGCGINDKDECISSWIVNVVTQDIEFWGVQKGEDVYFAVVLLMLFSEMTQFSSLVAFSVLVSLCFIGSCRQ